MGYLQNTLDKLRQKSKYSASNPANFEVLWSFQATRIQLFSLIFIFILIEWLGRQQQYAIVVLTNSWPKAIRYLFYYLIIIGILWFSGKEQQFIYFQF